MLEAAGESSLIVDVAFNNAPFMQPLAQLHTSATFVSVFRRCESFVRSATIVAGEDHQPAGWPDRSKPLTDREKVIALGRLKPAPGSPDLELWQEWSAIQRNIWLWTAVNTHLLEIIKTDENRHKVLFEDLVKEPDRFWKQFLKVLGIYNKHNLSHRVEKSATKTNDRKSYQIGPLSSWSSDEQALFGQIALPLEKLIYG